ncbi:MAG TPA: hypothetical protein VMH80_25930 [Bryobacteraceae bacterium]|nr:hypothetical protein [Bryobacteraceae bacterium]
MTRRLASFSAVALLSLPILAQSSAKSNWTPPKTAWGDPDIQGEWPATARIPMQRPVNFGNRAELTDAELAQREKQFQKQATEDGEEVASKGDNVTINPPSYWQERGKPDRQASLVVDPPNGRIPPLTPAGYDAVHSLRGGLGPGTHFPDKVDSWVDFDYYSRCISRGLVSSMLPTLYNFGNEILQAPGYVIIRNEMIHEARLIPLDGRPHVGSNIRTYMGDSRGHWEGNTLVVETTNLKAQPGAGGGLFSDAAVLIERFTRTSPTDLSYDLTVNDPKTWTAPWTIHMPYKLDPSYKIYEYACHEGNYMMLDALSGARDLEKKGESTKVIP